MTSIAYQITSQGFLVLAAFIIVLGSWFYVLFETTDKLGINYVSYPVSTTGRLLTFMLFGVSAAFSGLYLYSLVGGVGTYGLFVLMAFASLILGFRTSKACGYRILLPLTYLGVLSIGDILMGFLSSEGGYAFAGLGLLALVAVVGIVYRYRERKYPGYFITGLIFVLTSIGLQKLIAFYEPWPYAFLFLAMVVSSYLFAHGNKLRNTFDFRSAFSGTVMRLILLVASLLFVLGILQVFAPSMVEDFSQRIVLQMASGVSFLVPGVIMDIAVVCFAFLVFAILVMFGTKWSSPLTFLIFATFAALGLLSIIQSNVPGIWSPTPALAIATWLVLASVMFYEPTFKLVNRYTPVPQSLSLTARLRPPRAGALHGKHGEYQLDKTNIIGEGGFGKTYRGVDLKTNNLVAIKEPKYDQNDRQQREQALKQLERESGSLENLNFPGIVKWLDFLPHGGSYYVVEEFVNGRHLRKIVPSRGLNQSETVEFTRRILYGLNYLHMHGVLHRDLNPGNVMITAAGTVKLIDFGTSKKMTKMASTAFKKGSINAVGVDGYAPPEVDLVDPRISYSYDIYSVGALMYLMLTGKEAPSVRTRVLAPAQMGTDLAGRCDSKVASIVQKAMALDPQDRYQSVFETLAAIDMLRGNFILTDHSEIYNLTGIQEVTIVGDEDYTPVIGKLHNGESQVMVNAKGKRSEHIAKVEFNQKVGQFELVAEPKTSFSLWTRQAERNALKRYFLGREALFWLDEGGKDYRNGVFSYGQA